MIVILIVFGIPYTIFKLKPSIFLSYCHCCSKDTTTAEIRGEHWNTSLVVKGCWLIWRRHTYFHKSSNSPSISHNINVNRQSIIWTSRECGVFSTKTLISLSEIYSCFDLKTRCLSLSMSPQSKIISWKSGEYFLIDFHLLCHQTIIKMIFVLIIFVIQYTIDFILGFSIIRIHSNCFLKDTTKIKKNIGKTKVLGFFNSLHQF